MYSNDAILEQLKSQLVNINNHIETIASKKTLSKDEFEQLKFWHELYLRVCGTGLSYRKTLEEQKK